MKYRPWANLHMFFWRENDFIISYLPHGFGIKDCIHIRNRCISLGGDIRQRAAPTMEAAVPKPREWPVGLADEAPRAAAFIWGARSRPLASTPPRRHVMTEKILKLQLRFRYVIYQGRASFLLFCIGVSCILRRTLRSICLYRNIPMLLKQKTI